MQASAHSRTPRYTAYLRPGLHAVIVVACLAIAVISSSPLVHLLLEKHGQRLVVAFRLLLSMRCQSSLFFLLQLSREP